MVWKSVTLHDKGCISKGCVSCGFEKIYHFSDLLYLSSFLGSPWWPAAAAVSCALLELSGSLLLQGILCEDPSLSGTNPSLAAASSGVD